MANPDRLTGLDASFLSLERSGAHMHVGSVLVFEGDAPPYDEFVAKLEQRLHLVPRYRQKLAWPPLVQSRPVWIDDPHFNARYHVRHTALPAPAGEERAAQPGRARLRPGAGPLQAAVGAVAGRPRRRRRLRADLQDPPRARRRRLGRGHLDRAVRPRARPAGARPRAAVVPAPGAEPRPSCSPTSVAERASAPLDAARGALDAARHPERAVGGGGRAVTGLAAMAAAGHGRRAAEPAQRPDRLAPPLRVGRRGPRALQGDQDRARRHRQRRRAGRRDGRAARVPDPPRPRPGGHRAQGDGAGLRARRRRARRARQPRRGDVRAAAALRRGRRRSASASSTTRWAA